MAPIVAAMAQVSAAEKQAEADKFVAKTAAEASITQTKIQADVTRQLSNNQRELSEKNLAITQQLAREQEEARQQRVNMQLAALQQERQAQERERKELRAIEQERIDQQIAFAKQQADENLRLAKLSINTQLVTQGLATGVAPAGSRGRLSVGAAGSTGTSTSATVRAVGTAGEGRASADSQVASSLNRGLSGLVAGLAGVSNSGSSSNNSGSALGGTTLGGTSGAPQPRAQASRALLASVGNPQVGLANAKGGGSSTGGSRLGVSFPRGFSAASTTGFSMSGEGNAFSFSPANGVSQSLSRSLSSTTRAMMSTRENKNLIVGERGVSDLNLVLQSVRSGGSIAGGTQDFSDYFADQEKKLDKIGDNNKDAERELEGAYRPPTTGRALIGRKPAAERAHSLGY